MNDIEDKNVVLLSIPEVRERLGGIGRTLVWRLVTDGDLDGVKIGARSFVVEASVDAYIRSQLDRAAEARL